MKKSLTVTLVIISVFVLCFSACDTFKSTSISFRAIDYTEESFEELKSAIFSRLNCFYITDENIIFNYDQNNQIFSIDISGHSLSDEEIDSLLSSNTLTFSNYKGDVFLDCKNVVSASLEYDSDLIYYYETDGSYVKLVLTEEGAELLKDASREISTYKEPYNRYMNIKLGADVIMSPLVSRVISTSEVQLAGDYTSKDALNLATKISVSLIKLPFILVKN